MDNKLVCDSDDSEEDYYSLNSVTSENYTDETDKDSFLTIDELESSNNSNLNETLKITNEGNDACKNMEEVVKNEAITNIKENVNPDINLLNKSVESEDSYLATDDLLSSQILDNSSVDSLHFASDYRKKFNQYLKFFNDLSSKNNNQFPLSPVTFNSIKRQPIAAVNKITKLSPTKYINNKATNTDYIEVIHTFTQTDEDIKLRSSAAVPTNNVCNSILKSVNNDANREGIISYRLDNTLSQSFTSYNTFSKILTSISNSGDSVDNNSVSTVQSVNDHINQTGTNYCTANNVNKPNCSTTCAIALAISTHCKELHDLSQFQSPSLVKDQTTNLLSYFQTNSDSNILGMNNKLGLERKSENVVSSPVIRIDHISEENTISDESAIKSNKDISVLSPITTQLHHPNSQVNGSNSNCFKLNKSGVYTSKSLNLHQNKSLLDSMFLKTSTPIHQPNLYRNVPSTLPIHRNDGDGNVDYNRNQCHTLQSTKHKVYDFNKQAYISLYNLTCESLFDVNNNRKAVHNPANMFFNNSKSYGSLIETDLDTGKEEVKNIFKETNLDKYNISPWFNRSDKSRSMSNMLKTNKDEPDKFGYYSETLDENLLNQSSPSTNQLCSRLYKSANSPAQLKVAKSITKLNVPSWLDSVEFRVRSVPSSATSTTNNSISIASKGKEFVASPKSKTLPYNISESRQYNSPMSPSTLSVRHLKLSHTSPNKGDHKNIVADNKKRTSPTAVVLPSAKYKIAAYQKIQPIVQSLARKALNQKNRPTSEYGVKMRMKELSKKFVKEFLSKPLEEYDRYREKTKSISAVHGRVCSRLLCSHLIYETDVNSIVSCDYCKAAYCSTKCNSLDQLSHQKSCDYSTYLEWLDTLIESLSFAQITVLSDIFFCGLENIGTGLIRWRYDEAKQRPVTLSGFDLPYFVNLSSGQFSELKINQNIKLGKVPFSLVSVPICSKLPLVATKFLQVPIIKDLKTNSDNDSSVSCSLYSPYKRSLIVEQVKLDLQKFSVNIESSYPAIYDLLREYESKGKLFPDQQIFIPQSNNLITIKPDKNIEIIELL